MARVTIEESSLAAIAGAIREKNGTETTYKPADMASAISAIETGGTELTSEDEGKVVVESSGEYVLAAQTSLSVTENGTYDTTTNDEVTVNVESGGSTDAVATLIGGVSGPLSDNTVVNVRQSAQYGNSALTGLYLGQCLSVASEAFRNCTNISQVSLPKCTHVGYMAFNGCTKIEDLHIPECTTISSYAFSSTKSLTSVELTKCESIGERAFVGCGIQQLTLPVANFIGQFAFANSLSLSELRIAQDAMLSDGAFNGCSSLGYVRFDGNPTLSGTAFQRCLLYSVYMLGSSLASMKSSAVFWDTPMQSSRGGVYGSIYVPSSLYEAYISAPNWSFYSARIASYVEG